MENSSYRLPSLEKLTANPCVSSYSLNNISSARQRQFSCVEQLFT